MVLCILLNITPKNVKRTLPLALCMKDYCTLVPVCSTVSGIIIWENLTLYCWYLQLHLRSWRKNLAVHSRNNIIEIIHFNSSLNNLVWQQSMEVKLTSIYWFEIWCWTMGNEIGESSNISSYVLNCAGLGWILT